MNNNNIILTNLLDKKSSNSIALFVLIFPFSIKISILFLAIHFLITLDAGLRKRLIWKQIPLVLLASILFYLLHLSGLLFSENLKYGLKDIETKAGFVILPLLAIFLPRSKDEQFKFSWMWVISFVIASIYLLVRSTLLFIESRNSDVFFYDLYSVLIHPTYFTMMLNLAIIFLLNNNFIRDHPKSIDKNLCLLFLIVLLLSAGLTSSRAGTIVLIVTLVLFLLIQRKQILKSELLKISILICFILPFTFIAGSRFKLLVNEAMHTEVENKIVDVNPMAHRITLWKSSLNVAVNNPLGVGNGDVQDELVNEYRKTGFEKAVIVRYNSHNQYLQSLVGIGIPGLLALIFMIGSLLFYLILPGNNLLAGLLGVICGLNALFESVFEVERGVLFFVIMMAFMISPNRDKVLFKNS